MKHKPIFIHGHLFPSVAEAARELRIAPKTIRLRLQDPENKEYIPLSSLPNKEEFQVEAPTRGTATCFGPIASKLDT